MLAPDALGPTLCVGEILVEIMATTPGCGFRDVQSLRGPYPSGAPAIFAGQCGLMGGRAAMIGAVGADDFGALTLARLRADGVDVSAVAVDPDWPTGSAFVRYRPDGARDFVFNIARSAAARFEWSDAVQALVAQAGHLHVMGSALTLRPARDVIARAARVIRARGGSLSLDPNLRKELVAEQDALALFQQLLDQADLLLPSGDELFHAAGTPSDEAQAVAALHARGIAEIALKRGADGATVYDAGGATHHPGFHVAETDPTGAGDCFGGAYVTARRLGLPVSGALRLACAAGARNVTVMGPMEGAGTRAQLDAFAAAMPVRP